MRPTNKINIEFAERVAKAYQEMRHTPNEPETRQAYLSLAVETIRQYKMVLSYHLKVEFSPLKSPYRFPNDSIKDIAENYHLYVTPTLGNFGSDKNFKADGNPLLVYSGFYISGEPALINDLFRVIHDYFGHFMGQNGFRALGEENAYRYHCKMFSPLAVQALTTETRGQNCWLNYGPYGNQNRTAKQGGTIYADQKTGLLPDFCMGEY